MKPIPILFHMDFVRSTQNLLIIFMVLLPYLSLSQVQFSDISGTAGVNDAGSGQGVTSFDFNNDGLLDIYLVNNGQTNRLYKNLDGVSFSDEAAAQGVNYTGNGRGCAAGDYNNDGYTDLVIGNWTAKVILYRNDGTGFANATIEAGMDLTSWGGSINWFDYNNDGKLDCYVGNDGVPSHNNYFFHNEDLTSFSEIAASVGLVDDRSTLAVASADYDNDGDIDFFIGNQTGSPTGVLYRNDGTTFSNVTGSSGLITYSFSWGADWGDYDNDGDLDLYVCNSNNSNQCFENNGDGTFNEAATSLQIDDPSQSFSCGWADYDNDGDLDLYVSNGQLGTDKLYQNESPLPIFTNVISTSGISGNKHTGSFTWADFNNDGFLDLYLSNNGSTNQLYMSNAGNSNNWLVMKLEGVVSNRSAIGARVKVVAGGESMIREVQGGSGHNSQHSLPVEFGIGLATIIDSIIINWPSGIEQTFVNIVPNQILEIPEQYPTSTQEDPGVASFPGLQNNYPNPFRETTFIPVKVTRSTYVELVICDQLGREVDVLVDGFLTAGSYTFRWDASRFKEGIYCCRLVMNDYQGVQKMIRID